MRAMTTYTNYFTLPVGSLEMLNEVFEDAHFCFLPCRQLRNVCSVWRSALTGFLPCRQLRNAFLSSNSKRLPDFFWEPFG